MIKNVLGKDFYSILDDNLLDIKKDSITTISLSNIEPRKDQPRKQFDDESLQLLADSIAIHGVLQPIIVRENSLYPDTYEIIAGERRWRAARMAGLSEIPVVIVDGDDLKIAQISLVENVQREDLNPVEEAFAYQALIDKFGLTQEQLSKEVGKSRSAIANMLRLTDLPDEVLELLRDGKISSGHARALLSLEEDEQMTSLANRIVNEDLSVRRVEEIVKKILVQKDIDQLKETPTESIQRRVYIRDLERRAMDVLGRRVK
ncbi:MAG: ParB/RepB/Spo0J family partition protein, partial [Eubacteriales bacterium]